MRSDRSKKFRNSMVNITKIGEHLYKVGGVTKTWSELTPDEKAKVLNLKNPTKQSKDMKKNKPSEKELRDLFRRKDEKEK